MRALLALASRAFPRDHRARESGELIDTALLAADGSAWRAAGEACSLVVAGLRQRLHTTTAGDSSVREGLLLLAGVIALLNLVIALYGLSFVVSRPPFGYTGPPGFFLPDPYVVDWWWIAFAVAAAGVVVGLALGNRRLAFGAALASLGLVAYDTLSLASVHMRAFAPYGGPDGYPVGPEWVSPAIILALATFSAPMRRRSLLRVPLALAAALPLVLLARYLAGGFIFLRWPVGLVVALAVMLGWWAPQLAVVGVGLSVALAPYVVEYLSTPSWMYHAPAVTWVAAPGLALGIVLPLAYLVRRRLT